MKRILFLTMAVWLLCSGTAWAQDKMAVQVSVTDVNGEPLPGASVLEVGTRNTATADANGQCVINVPTNATLEVSFMGYASKQVTATRAAIDVQLEEDGVLLSEVVMVGYGTQKKVNLTGAKPSYHFYGKCLAGHHSRCANYPRQRCAQYRFGD